MKSIIKRIIPVVIILIVVLIILIDLYGNNKTVSQKLFAMDTYMELMATGKGSKAAVEAAVAEIESLDRLLSTGDEGSEIAQINSTKNSRVSDTTLFLIKKSFEICDNTDGAFDITVFPIMKAWGFAGGDFRVPEEGELQELLQYVDNSKIEYNETDNTVLLPENVEIDLGGIAKGYTSSKVADIMREHGIKHAILNLGGNVQTVGSKQDGSPWRIAVKSPVEMYQYLGVISVVDKAVITSGGYERYFTEGDVTYHHIIDPTTGKPANSGLISVTIVSEDGTLADGLSTALFVMGKDRAVEYWKEHSESFDAILMDEAGMLYVTEGIEQDFSSELSVDIIRK